EAPQVLPAVASWLTSDRQARGQTPRMFLQQFDAQELRCLVHPFRRYRHSRSSGINNRSAGKRLSYDEASNARVVRRDASSAAVASASTPQAAKTAGTLRPVTSATTPPPSSPTGIRTRVNIV